MGWVRPFSGTPRAGDGRGATREKEGTGDEAWSLWTLINGSRLVLGMPRVLPASRAKESRWPSGTGHGRQTILAREEGGGNLRQAARGGSVGGAGRACESGSNSSVGHAGTVTEEKAKR